MENGTCEQERTDEERPENKKGSAACADEPFRILVGSASFELATPAV
jgi:hypothetical protein